MGWTPHSARIFIFRPKGKMQDMALKTWLTANAGWTARDYNEFRAYIRQAFTVCRVNAVQITWNDVDARGPLI
ncbi:MAG: hypothetical protein CYPHOPRED_005928 [Cyphobasidiales sp. Tagirdzhanova-0007]|nr:MAG: hypothetical protein CYPHOPRED_005928 [Cyphobasidiales sp. Tagirdzhanova-0007]